MVSTKAPIQIAFFSLALSMEMVVSSGFARQPTILNILALSDRASHRQLLGSQQTAELISQKEGAANNQRPNSWNDFESPERGLPGGRPADKPPQWSGCPKNSIPLIPKSKMGRTVLAQPTFLYYVPRAIDKKVEFDLTDESDKTIYKTSFRMITQAPGIVSINFLAESLVSLEPGKNYKLYFTIKCKPDDSEMDIVVSGWINRINMTPALTSQLDGAKSERDRLSIYAKELLWYEYISTLASLRDSQPTDSELTTKWSELLSEVGLERIAEQPLVQSQFIPDPVN